MKRAVYNHTPALALPKRSKQIHKQTKEMRNRITPHSLTPTTPLTPASQLPNVYDFLDQCSDVHKILLKSQQILNDAMRELEDMDTQLEAARNDTVPDAMTVDLESDENFGAVNHKFMFNELGDEYSDALEGIERLKSGGCDFGSLYTKIGHSFAGGEAKKCDESVKW